ncbi:LacI family DNA-binding transcriptional regulator [Acidisoma silvae]|uniref:LacI family DNA-binding transcriptional regulator n=1 Tax=Acidisoma silvae TaxID=2802396 RepID=UPI0029CAB884|nr:substrate-binding domain-containing protein [Acidisoma silvae]
MAEAAGVSTATVSRAFNTPAKVAPAVRDRVFAAAAILGWLPHAAGSALARRRTSIAGVVIPTLGQEVFATQVEAMQAAFAEHDITLLIGCSNYDPDQAAQQVRTMLARGVDALAVLGQIPQAGLFEVVQARRVPFVITYGSAPGSTHPCVGFDNATAFSEITRYLLALGHQIFGMILPPTLHNERIVARLAGVRSALADEGLGLRPQHIFEGEYGILAGRKALRQILGANGPRPTAIICGNDLLAIGALFEARTMGLVVPRDLSITGFDDISMAGEIDPALTTMKVNNVEIGRLAVEYLVSQLCGEAAPSEVLILPALVERSTTAPPPK